MPSLGLLSGAMLITSILVLYGIPSSGASSGIDNHLLHQSSALPESVDILSLYQKKELRDYSLDNAYSLYGASYLVVHDDWINTEISCEFCYRIEYVPPSNPSAKAEISFASSTLYNFTDMKKMSFYVMGEDGGEELKFKVAGRKAIDKVTGKLSQFANYDLATKPVSLSKKWKKLEIDLSKTNLKGITNPLAIEMNGTDTDKPVIFYLKGVRYDSAISKNPLPTENGRDLANNG